MKIGRLISATILSFILLAACSDYNTTEVKDNHKGEERIYGNVGGPAKQLENKYESNPKTADKVRTIREKLFPSK